MITTYLTPQDEPLPTCFSHSVEKKSAPPTEDDLANLSINQEKSTVSDRQIVPRTESSSGSQEVTTYPTESTFSSTSTVSTVAPEIATVSQDQKAIVTAAKKALYHFISKLLPEIRKQIEEQTPQIIGNEELNSLELQITKEDESVLAYLAIELKLQHIQLALNMLEVDARKYYSKMQNWLKKEATLHESRYSGVSGAELREAKKLTDNEEDLNEIEHYSLVICLPDILDDFYKKLEDIDKRFRELPRLVSAEEVV